MKLEVGMYVRTIERIVKIEKILDGVMWDTQGHLHFGDFIKASHNIIDLIEVGDYVNGEKVVAIHERYVWDEEDLGKALETACNYTATLNEDIKSIITKEQFESMSYKVGE